MLVQSVDRATFVGTGDDIRLRNARKWVVHDLGDKGLPFSAYSRDIEAGVVDDSLNERRLAKSTDDDGGRGFRGRQL